MGRTTTRQGVTLHFPHPPGSQAALFTPSCRSSFTFRPALNEHLPLLSFINLYEETLRHQGEEREHHLSERTRSTVLFWQSQRGIAMYHEHEREQPLSAQSPLGLGERNVEHESRLSTPQDLQ